MPRKGRFATTNEPFRPPLQARSRETHRRILEATGALLKRKTFEALTVAEIARGAASSVGAFYARFEDKSALLEQLDAMCAEEVSSGWGQGRGKSESLEERVAGGIRFFVALYRKRAGLIRALRLGERGGLRTRFAERVKESGRVLLVEPVLAERRRVGHPDPQLAVTLGSLMVMSVVEERVLFPEMTSSPTPITDATLVKELTSAYLAYLAVS